MKKLLIICILIVSVIFISGCTSDEQASSEISTSSYSNQESGTQNPELIIKQSDVPGFTLEKYSLYAVPKNTVYILNQDASGKSYTDTLELGYRKVQEMSTWEDQSGRTVQIVLNNYDSNTGLIEYMNTLETITNEQLKAQEEKFDTNFDFGNPNIGDNSYYFSSTDIDMDIKWTTMYFIYKNNFIMISTKDDKDKAYGEAMRIAKLVKSRLD